MKVFITSNCAGAASLGVALDQLHSAGFNKIELSGGHTCSQADFEKIFSLKDAGVDFLIHHYFPPPSVPFVLNLSSDDAEIRQQTFEHIDQAIALAQRLGSDFYSVHAGYALDQIPRMTKSGIFEQIQKEPVSEDNFYASLETLSARLPQGFRVALENGIPTTQPHLATPDQFFRFLDFIQAIPNLGLLIDLAHLKVSSTHYGFDMKELLESIVVKYSEQIYELHISANDGTADSHFMCAADSFEISFLVEHKGLLEDVPVVMEWHNCLTSESRSTFEQIESLLR